MCVLNMHMCEKNSSSTIPKWYEAAEWQVDRRETFKFPVDLDNESFPSEASSVSAYFYGKMAHAWEPPKVIHVTHEETPHTALTDACRQFVFDKILNCASTWDSGCDSNSDLGCLVTRVLCGPSNTMQNIN